MLPELAKRLVAVGNRTRNSRAERDRLIVEAHAAGAGVREIARLVGLTHPGVIRIINRKESE